MLHQRTSSQFLIGVQGAFEKGLIARILIILCLVFIVFGIIFLSIRIILTIHPSCQNAHWTDLLIESLIFFVGLASLWFIRLDRMKAASSIVLGGMLFAVTMQAYFLGDPLSDIAGAIGLQLTAILAIVLLDLSDRWITIILIITVYIGIKSSLLYRLLAPNSKPQSI